MAEAAGLKVPREAAFLHDALGGAQRIAVTHDDLIVLGVIRHERRPAARREHLAGTAVRAHRLELEGRILRATACGGSGLARGGDFHAQGLMLYP